MQRALCTTMVLCACARMATGSLSCLDLPQPRCTTACPRRYVLGSNMFPSMPWVLPPGVPPEPRVVHMGHWQDNLVNVSKNDFALAVPSHRSVAGKVVVDRADRQSPAWPSFRDSSACPYNIYFAITVRTIATGHQKGWN